MPSRRARTGTPATLRRALVLVACALACAPARAAACPRACAGEVAACRRSECGLLRGGERHRCVRACRARSTCTAPGVRLRTLAYVMSECEEVPGGLTFRQRLLVRRGNCAPVTLLELPPVGPVADPAGLCRIFGGFRNGFGSVGIGAVQRFSVLPDGSALVVELNNDHSLFPSAAPEPPEEGIFLLQADGSGMKRLGPASRIPLLIVEGSSFRFNDNIFFPVSPDGRTIAFSDLVPGPDGGESRQLVAIDVPTGRLMQVTRVGLFSSSTFLDNDTIFFYAGDPPTGYTVKPDGSHLRQLPPVVAIEGSRVQPIFGLAGGGGNVVELVLPRKADRTYGVLTNVVESFLIDGDDVLQLTNFRYPDTFAVSGRDRVFVVASADPLGTNPTGDCQIFSIGRLGGGLRQLTAFNDAGRIQMGCSSATPPGVACTVFGLGLIQDLVTGMVGFVTSCDPVGLNPYGFQVFTMRPDGTGLRQVTAARGMETLPDGRVRVELPGPIAYSALLGR